VVPYERRQPVLARFLIGQILGLSAGVLAGGVAADAGNWRLPFVGIALVFITVCAGLLLLNRRLPVHARGTHRASGSALRRMVGEFRQVLSRPWARTVLLSVALEGAFLYGSFAFIATHIYRTFHLPLTTAGALVMLFGLGGLLFALASASLVRRLGETGLARWGGILMSLALLAIALAPVWWWAIPGCCAAGLGFYMVHNTLQINATQMAPERRGAAVAAFASCFFLGQSIGVGMGGAVVERVGTAAILVVGAIGVMAVSLRFSIRLKSKVA
jgi:predicted MFS family arabinose efflux permease